MKRMIENLNIAKMQDVSSCNGIQNKKSQVINWGHLEGRQPQPTQFATILQILAEIVDTLNLHQTYIDEGKAGMSKFRTVIIIVARFTVFVNCMQSCERVRKTDFST